MPLIGDGLHPIWGILVIVRIRVPLINRIAKEPPTPDLGIEYGSVPVATTLMPIDFDPWRAANLDDVRISGEKIEHRIKPPACIYLVSASVGGIGFSVRFTVAVMSKNGMRRSEFCLNWIEDAEYFIRPKPFRWTLVIWFGIISN